MLSVSSCNCSWRHLVSRRTRAADIYEHQQQQQQHRHEMELVTGAEAVEATSPHLLCPSLFVSQWHEHIRTMAVNGHAGEQWPPKNKPTHERYINFKTSQDIVHRQGGRGRRQKGAAGRRRKEAAGGRRQDSASPHLPHTFHAVTTWIRQHKHSSRTHKDRQAAEID